MISKRGGALLILILITFSFTSASQESCFTNNDCSSDFQVCSCAGETCSDDAGQCIHKSIFPLKAIEICGILTISVLIVLANAAGIGGGSLLLPCLALLLRFEQIEAEGISNALVFVSALTRLFFSLKQKHPRKDRTIIDYSIVAIMLPTGLLGTVIGVFLNKTLPEGVQVIVLAILLLFVTYATLRKGIKLFKAESRSLKSKVQAQTSMIIESYTPLLALRQERLLSEQQKQDLEDIYKSERSHLPLKKLMYVWIVFVALVVTSLAKDLSGDSNECGTLEFLIKGILVVICVMSSLFASRYILNIQKQKEKLGYDFDEEDVQWTKNNLMLLVSASLFCGALASALGIGGGVLYNPLLLSIGVNPQVASASGMYILFYNTLATVLQLVIANRLYILWALFLGVFVMCFSVIGITVVMRQVKKTGRQSVLVMLLAGLIGISAVVIPVFAFMMKPPGLWSFGRVC